MKLRPLFFALLLILPLMKALPADPPPGKKDRSHGLMQTVWSGADSFLKEYYSEEPEASEKGQVGSLNQIIQHYKGAQ